MVQVFRDSRNRICFTISSDLLVVQIYLNDITFLYVVRQILAFKQQDTIVNGISKENTCKRLGNDAVDTICHQNLCRLLSGGTTAEVASCYDQVTFPKLRSQIRS